MRRIIMLVTVALVMAAMMASTALPAPAVPAPTSQAQEEGQAKACKNSNSKAFGGCF